MRSTKLIVCGNIGFFLLVHVHFIFFVSLNCMYYKRQFISVTSTFVLLDIIWCDSLHMHVLNDEPVCILFRRLIHRIVVVLGESCITNHDYWTKSVAAIDNLNISHHKWFAEERHDNRKLTSKEDQDCASNCYILQVILECCVHYGALVSSCAIVSIFVYRCFSYKSTNQTSVLDHFAVKRYIVLSDSI